MEVDDLQMNTGDSDDVVGAIIGGVVALSLVAAGCIWCCSKIKCRMRNTGLLGLN